MESGRQTFLIATAIAVALASTGLAAAQNPVPLISQPLVPDAARPGGAAFTLTVNGDGLVPTSVVNWNGSARATSFVNTSKLTASILASDIATARTASVTVVSPGPGGGTSNSLSFSINAVLALCLKPAFALPALKFLIILNALDAGLKASSTNESTCAELP